MVVVKFLQWTQMFAQLSFALPSSLLSVLVLSTRDVSLSNWLCGAEDAKPVVIHKTFPQLTSRKDRKESLWAPFFLVMVISDGDGSQIIYDHENIFVWLRLSVDGWSSGVTMLTIVVVVHDAPSAWKRRKNLGGLNGTISNGEDCYFSCMRSVKIYLIGQNFGGQKFRRTKFFGGQNFGSFVQRKFFIGFLFPYTL